MVDSSEQPKRRAIALEYSAETEGRGGAPKVSAKGAGQAATRILELAEEHGIPIHEDADLLGLLGHCDVGEEIPDALYGAVAEVLVWLHLANRS